MTLSAADMASTLKGLKFTSTGGKVATFPVLQMPTAIATALAAQQKQPQGTYFWGQQILAGNSQVSAGDFGTQAGVLMGWLGAPDWSWSKVPTYTDGSYLQYMPEATAAAATAPAAGGNDFQQVNPDPTLGLADLISGTAHAVNNVTDPLWWRQVYFVAGGWILIAIAVAQMVNRGLVTPVRRGIQSADDVAWDIASLNTNVVGPAKSALKTARAKQKARTARIKTATGTGPRQRKQPLQGPFTLTGPTQSNAGRPAPYAQSNYPRPKG